MQEILCAILKNIANCFKPIHKALITAIYAL